MAGQLEPQRQRLGGVDVVVGDEDAAPGLRRQRTCVDRRRAALGLVGGHAAVVSGRRTANLGAAARPVAARGDRPVVHLDQPPHQREADAEAALSGVSDAVDLREQVEHAVDDVGRDADPRCP